MASIASIGPSLSVPPLRGSSTPASSARPNEGKPADTAGGVPRRVSVVGTPGEEEGFNPQPEPPGRESETSRAPTAPGEEVGFNPQPEPPGQPVLPSPGAPGEEVGFNPQPEPPGHESETSLAPTAPGEEVGFNPQPEPPGQPASLVGLNPQPEPPSAEAVPSPGTPGEEVGFNPQPEPPGQPAVTAVPDPGSVLLRELAEFQVALAELARALEAYLASVAQPQEESVDAVG